MGRKTDGSDWRIAVKDPADTESYLGVVSAADKFIVTSGVYERYFEPNKCSIFAPIYKTIGLWYM